MADESTAAGRRGCLECGAHTFNTVACEICGSKTLEVLEEKTGPRLLNRPARTLRGTPRPRRCEDP